MKPCMQSSLQAEGFLLSAKAWSCVVCFVCAMCVLNLQVVRGGESARFVVHFESERALQHLGYLLGEQKVTYASPPNHQYTGPYHGSSNHLPVCVPHT